MGMADTWGVAHVLKMLVDAASAALNRVEGARGTEALVPARGAGPLDLIWGVRQREPRPVR